MALPARKERALRMKAARVASSRYSVMLRGVHSRR
jgi:hypothetical protein